MSFKASVTAVMLVVLGIVYGWYFAQVLIEAGSTPVADIAYQDLLLVMVAILVVLSIIGVAIVAVLRRRESGQEDERDKVIEMRGDQVGSYVLAVAALAAMGLAMLEGEYFWIAHVLLAGLVLSEMAKAVVMLLAYRRGF